MVLRRERLGSGPGEELARVIDGAGTALVEECDRMWDLLYGDRFRLVRERSDTCESGSEREAVAVSVVILREPLRGGECCSLSSSDCGS